MLGAVVSYSQVKVIGDVPAIGVGLDHLRHGLHFEHQLHRFGGRSAQPHQARESCPMATVALGIPVALLSFPNSILVVEKKLSTGLPAAFRGTVQLRHESAPPC